MLRQIRNLVSLLSLLFMVGCGLLGGSRGDNGELVGVAGREGWTQTIPYGMTFIPPGTFHMGQADEDITSSKINLNKQITISSFYMDDTEITNNEYRQFMEYMLNAADTSADWNQDEVMAKLYPDTTVWIKDFTHHLGDPMEKYYYSHPAYDDYPVVGVDWLGAVEFCKWRTDYLNTYRESEGMFPMPDFRLPTEGEWEYAARGGRDMAKYPWGGPYMRNAFGCVLANFKPGRGNYYDDGFSYVAPTASFFPNDFNLYDMAGNVSEWCDDAFHPAGYTIVWDLNPTYRDEKEQRKVVRGGSWKDISFYVETGTRAYEYQDTARSFIGFRTVMTYLGRSSGLEFSK